MKMVNHFANSLVWSNFKKLVTQVKRRKEAASERNLAHDPQVIF